MKIAVIGTGYVGLVTGTCLAELGNEVFCVDSNAEKIAVLNKGEMPIFEPGLEELVKRHFQASRLHFSTDLQKAVEQSEIIFIAVGTPSKPNGDADLSFVEKVAQQIAEHATESKLVVEKSTVPVETGKMLQELLKQHNGHKATLEVVSNPEFLREGSAVHDFLHPDRIVIGTNSEKARQKMEELYAPLKAPLIFTDINSAELIKHASNSFLALKISYANALANICEVTGSDIEAVVHGMGLDPRIGNQFLRAGIGFGGSCFPKDVQAFVKIAEKKGYSFELLNEVQRINAFQRIHFFEKIKKRLGNLSGKKIAALGLSFKPDTDDLRDAPAVEIIQMLEKAGAQIAAFDPVSMPNASEKLPKTTFSKNEFEAMQAADAAVIFTEWSQFRELDWVQAKAVLKNPLIFDGRNMFVPAEMKEKGFEYISVGRKTL